MPAWTALPKEQKAEILKLIERDLKDRIYGMSRYDAGLALAAIGRAIRENDPQGLVSLSKDLKRGQGFGYRMKVNAAARHEVLTSAPFWVSMVFGTFSMWVVTHEIAAIVHYAEGIDKIIGVNLFGTIIKTIEGDQEKQKEYAEMAQRGEYVPVTNRLVASGLLNGLQTSVQGISTNLVVQPYVIAKQAAQQAPILRANLGKIADDRFGFAPTIAKAEFLNNGREQINAMEKTTYWSIVGPKLARVADFAGSAFNAFGSVLVMSAQAEPLPAVGSPEGAPIAQKEGAGSPKIAPEPATPETLPMPTSDEISTRISHLDKGQASIDSLLDIGSTPEDLQREKALWDGLNDHDRWIQYWAVVNSQTARTLGFISNHSRDGEIVALGKELYQTVHSNGDMRNALDKLNEAITRIGTEEKQKIQALQEAKRPLMTPWNLFATTEIATAEKTPAAGAKEEMTPTETPEEKAQRERLEALTARNAELKAAAARQEKENVELARQNEEKKRLAAELEAKQKQEETARLAQVEKDRLAEKAAGDKTELEMREKIRQIYSDNDIESAERRFEQISAEAKTLNLPEANAKGITEQLDLLGSHIAELKELRAAAEKATAAEKLASEPSPVSFSGKIWASREIPRISEKGAMRLNRASTEVVEMDLANLGDARLVTVKSGDGFLGFLNQKQLPASPEEATHVLKNEKLYRIDKTRNSVTSAAPEAKTSAGSETMSMSERIQSNAEAKRAVIRSLAEDLSPSLWKEQADLIARLQLDALVKIHNSKTWKSPKASDAAFDKAVASLRKDIDREVKKWTTSHYSQPQVDAAVTRITDEAAKAFLQAPAATQAPAQTSSQEASQQPAPQPLAKPVSVAVAVSGPVALSAELPADLFKTSAAASAKAGLLGASEELARNVMLKGLGLTDEQTAMREKRDLDLVLVSFSEFLTTYLANEISDRVWDKSSTMAADTKVANSLSGVVGFFETLSGRYVEELAKIAPKGDISKLTAEQSLEVLKTFLENREGMNALANGTLSDAQRQLLQEVSTAAVQQRFRAQKAEDDKEGDVPKEPLVPLAVYRPGEPLRLNEILDMAVNKSLETGVASRLIAEAQAGLQRNARKWTLSAKLRAGTDFVFSGVGVGVEYSMWFSDKTENERIALAKYFDRDGELAFQREVSDTVREVRRHLNNYTRTVILEKDLREHIEYLKPLVKEAAARNEAGMDVDGDSLARELRRVERSLADRLVEKQGILRALGKLIGVSGFEIRLAPELENPVQNNSELAKKVRAEAAAEVSQYGIKYEGKANIDLALARGKYAQDVLGTALKEAREKMGILFTARVFYNIGGGFDFRSPISLEFDPKTHPMIHRISRDLAALQYYQDAQAIKAHLAGLKARAETAQLMAVMAADRFEEQKTIRAQETLRYWKEAGEAPRQTATSEQYDFAKRQLEEAYSQQREIQIEIDRFTSSVDATLAKFEKDIEWDKEKARKGESRKLFDEDYFKAIEEAEKNELAKRPGQEEGPVDAKTYESSLKSGVNANLRTEELRAWENSERLIQTLHSSGVKFSGTIRSLDVNRDGKIDANKEGEVKISDLQEFERSLFSELERATMPKERDFFQRTGDLFRKHPRTPEAITADILKVNEAKQLALREMLPEIMWSVWRRQAGYDEKGSGGKTVHHNGSIEVSMEKAQAIYDSGKSTPKQKDQAAKDLEVLGFSLARVRADLKALGDVKGKEWKFHSNPFVRGGAEGIGLVDGGKGAGPFAVWNIKENHDGEADFLFQLLRGSELLQVAHARDFAKNVLIQRQFLDQIQLRIQAFDQAITSLNLSDQKLLIVGSEQDPSAELIITVQSEEAGLRYEGIDQKNRKLSARVLSMEGGKRVVEIKDADGKLVFVGNPKLPQYVRAELSKGVLVQLKEMNTISGITDEKKVELERQILWGRQRLSIFAQAKISLEAEYERAKERTVRLLGHDYEDKLDYVPGNSGSFMAEQDFRALITNGMKFSVPEKDRRNFDPAVDQKIAEQRLRIQYSQMTVAQQKGSLQLAAMAPFISSYEGTKETSRTESYDEEVNVGDGVSAVVPRTREVVSRDPISNIGIGGAASLRFYAGHLSKDKKLNVAVAEENLRRMWEDYREFRVREALVSGNLDDQIFNTKKQKAETERLRTEIDRTIWEYILKEQRGRATFRERNLYTAIRNVDSRVQLDNLWNHQLNLRLLEIERAIKDVVKSDPPTQRERVRLSQMGVRNEHLAMTPDNLKNVIETSSDRVAKSNAELDQKLSDIQRHYRFLRHFGASLEIFKMPLGLGSGDDLQGGVRLTTVVLENFTDTQVRKSALRAKQSAFDNQYRQDFNRRLVELAWQDVKFAKSILQIRENEAREREAMEKRADAGNAEEDQDAISGEVTRTSVMVETARRDLNIAVNMLKFIVGIPESVSIDIPDMPLREKIDVGAEIGTKMAENINGMVKQILDNAVHDPRYQSILNNIGITKSDEVQAWNKRWYETQVGVFAGYHFSVGFEGTVRLIDREKSALLELEKAKRVLAELQTDPVKHEILLQALNEYAAFIHNWTRVVQLDNELVRSSSLSNAATHGYRTVAAAGRPVKTMSDVLRAFDYRENDSLRYAGIRFEFQKNLINLSSSLTLMGLAEGSQQLENTTRSAPAYRTQHRDDLQRLSQTAALIDERSKRVSEAEAKPAPRVPANSENLYEKFPEEVKSRPHVPREKYLNEKNKELYEPYIKDLWKVLYRVPVDVTAEEKNEDGSRKGALTPAVLVEDGFVRLFDVMQLSPNGRLAMLEILSALARDPYLGGRLRQESFQKLMASISRDEKLGLNYAQLIEGLFSSDTVIAKAQGTTNSTLDKTTDFRILGMYVYYAASILKALDPKDLDSMEAAKVPELVKSRFENGFFKQSFTEQLNFDFIFLTKTLENIAAQEKYNRLSPEAKKKFDQLPLAERQAQLKVRPTFTPEEIALITKDGILSGAVDIKDKRLDFQKWLVRQRALGVTEDEAVMKERFASYVLRDWIAYGGRQVSEQPFFKVSALSDTFEDLEGVRQIAEPFFRTNFNRTLAMYGNIDDLAIIAGLSNSVIMGKLYDKDKDVCMNRFKVSMLLAGHVLEYEYPAINELYGKLSDEELSRLPAGALLRFLEANARPGSFADQREIQKERASLRNGLLMGEVFFRTLHAVEQYAKEHKMDLGKGLDQLIKTSPEGASASDMGKALDAMVQKWAPVGNGEPVFQTFDTDALSSVRKNVHDFYSMAPRIRDALKSSGLLPDVDMLRNADDRGIVSAWFDYANRYGQKFLSDGKTPVQKLTAEDLDLLIGVAGKLYPELEKLYKRLDLRDEENGSKNMGTVMAHAQFVLLIYGHEKGRAAAEKIATGDPKITRYDRDLSADFKYWAGLSLDNPDKENIRVEVYQQRLAFARDFMANGSLFEKAKTIFELLNPGRKFDLRSEDGEDFGFLMTTAYEKHRDHISDSELARRFDAFVTLVTENPEGDAKDNVLTEYLSKIGALHGKSIKEEFAALRASKNDRKHVELAGRINYFVTQYDDLDTIKTELKKRIAFIDKLNIEKNRVAPTKTLGQWLRELHSGTSGRKGLYEAHKDFYNLAWSILTDDSDYEITFLEQQVSILMNVYDRFQKSARKTDISFSGYWTGYSQVLKATQDYPLGTTPDYLRDEFFKREFYVKLKNDYPYLDLAREENLKKLEQFFVRQSLQSVADGFTGLLFARRYPLETKISTMLDGDAFLKDPKVTALIADKGMQPEQKVDQLLALAGYFGRAREVLKTAKAEMKKYNEDNLPLSREKMLLRVERSRLVLNLYKTYWETAGIYLDSADIEKILKDKRFQTDADLEEYFKLGALFQALVQGKVDSPIVKKYQAYLPAQALKSLEKSNFGRPFRYQELGAYIDQLLRELTEIRFQTEIGKKTAFLRAVNQIAFVHMKDPTKNFMHTTDNPETEKDRDARTFTALYLGKGLEDGIADHWYPSGMDQSHFRSRMTYAGAIVENIRWTEFLRKFDFEKENFKGETLDGFISYFLASRPAKRSVDVTGIDPEIRNNKEGLVTLFQHRHPIVFSQLSPESIGKLTGYAGSILQLHSVLNDYSTLMEDIIEKWGFAPDQNTVLASILKLRAGAHLENTLQAENEILKYFMADDLKDDPLSDLPSVKLATGAFIEAAKKDLGLTLDPKLGLEAKLRASVENGYLDKTKIWIVLKDLKKLQELKATGVNTPAGQLLAHWDVPQMLRLIGTARGLLLVDAGVISKEDRVLTEAGALRVDKFVEFSVLDRMNIVSDHLTHVVETTSKTVGAEIASKERQTRKDVKEFQSERNTNNRLVHALPAVIGIFLSMLLWLVKVSANWARKQTAGLGRRPSMTGLPAWQTSPASSSVGATPTVPPTAGKNRLGLSGIKEALKKRWLDQYSLRQFVADVLHAGFMALFLYFGYTTIDMANSNVYSSLYDTLVLMSAMLFLNARVWIAHFYDKFFPSKTSAPGDRYGTERPELDLLTPHFRLAWEAATIEAIKQFQSGATSDLPPLPGLDLDTPEKIAKVKELLKKWPADEDLKEEWHIHEGSALSDGGEAYFISTDSPLFPFLMKKLPPVTGWPSDNFDMYVQPKGQEGTFVSLKSKRGKDAVATTKDGKTGIIYFQPNLVDKGLPTLFDPKNAAKLNRLAELLAKHIDWKDIVKEMGSFLDQFNSEDAPFLMKICMGALVGNLDPDGRLAVLISIQLDGPYVERALILEAILKAGLQSKLEKLENLTDAEVTTLLESDAVNQILKAHGLQPAFIKQNFQDYRKYAFTQKILDYVRLQAMITGEQRFGSDSFYGGTIGALRGGTVPTEVLNRARQLLYWMPQVHEQREKKLGMVHSLTDYLMGQDGPRAIKEGMSIPFTAQQGRNNDQVGHWITLLVSGGIAVLAGLAVTALFPLMAGIPALVFAGFVFWYSMTPVKEILLRFRKSNLKIFRGGEKYYPAPFYTTESSAFGFSPQTHLRRKVKDGFVTDPQTGRQIRVNEKGEPDPNGELVANFLKNENGMNLVHTADNKNGIGDNPADPVWRGVTKLQFVVAKLTKVMLDPEIRKQGIGVIVPSTEVLTNKKDRTMYTMFNDLSSTIGDFFRHGDQKARATGNFSGKGLVHLDAYYGAGDARSSVTPATRVIKFMTIGLIFGAIAGLGIGAFFTLLLAMLGFSSTAVFIGLVFGSAALHGGWGAVIAKQLSHDYKEGAGMQQLYLLTVGITEPSTSDFLSAIPRAYLRWFRGDLMRVIELFQPGYPMKDLRGTVYALGGYIVSAFFGLWIIKRFIVDPASSGYANFFSYVGHGGGATEYFTSPLVSPPVCVALAIAFILTHLFLSFMASRDKHIVASAADRGTPRHWMGAGVAVAFLLLFFGAVAGAGIAAVIALWGLSNWVILVLTILTLPALAAWGIAKFPLEKIFPSLPHRDSPKGYVLFNSIRVSAVLTGVITGVWATLYLMVGSIVAFSLPGTAFLLTTILFIVIAFPILMGSQDGKLWQKFQSLHLSTSVFLADPLILLVNLWMNGVQIMILGTMDYEKKWADSKMATIAQGITYLCRAGAILIPIYVIVKWGVIGAKLTGAVGGFLSGTLHMAGIATWLGAFPLAYPLIGFAVTYWIVTSLWSLSSEKVMALTLEEKEFPWGTFTDTKSEGHDTRLIKSARIYTDALKLGVLAVVLGVVFNAHLWTFLFGVFFLWSFGLASWYVWLMAKKVEADYPETLGSEAGKGTSKMAKIRLAFQDIVMQRVWLTLKRVVSMTKLEFVGKNKAYKERTSAHAIAKIKADFAKLGKPWNWTSFDGYFGNLLFVIGFWTGVAAAVVFVVLFGIHAAFLIPSYGLGHAAYVFFTSVPVLALLPALTAWALFFAPWLIFAIPYAILGGPVWGAFAVIPLIFYTLRFILMSYENFMQAGSNRINAGHAPSSLLYKALYVVGKKVDLWWITLGLKWKQRVLKSAERANNADAVKAAKASIQDLNKRLEEYEKKEKTKDDDKDKTAKAIHYNLVLMDLKRKEAALKEAEKTEEAKAVKRLDQEIKEISSKQTLDVDLLKAKEKELKAAKDTKGALAVEILEQEIGGIPNIVGIKDKLKTLTYLAPAKRVHIEDMPVNLYRPYHEELEKVIGAILAADAIIGDVARSDAEKLAATERRTSLLVEFYILATNDVEGGVVGPLRKGANAKDRWARPVDIHERQRILQVSRTGYGPSMSRPVFDAWLGGIPGKVADVLTLDPSQVPDPGSDYFKALLAATHEIVAHEESNALDQRKRQYNLLVALKEISTKKSTVTEVLDRKEGAYDFNREPFREELPLRMRIHDVFWESVPNIFNIGIVLSLVLYYFNHAAFLSIKAWVSAHFLTVVSGGILSGWVIGIGAVFVVALIVYVLHTLKEEPKTRGSELPGQAAQLQQPVQPGQPGQTPRQNPAPAAAATSGTTAAQPKKTIKSIIKSVLGRSESREAPIVVEPIPEAIQKDLAQRKPAIARVRDLDALPERDLTNPKFFEQKGLAARFGVPGQESPRGPGFFGNSAVLFLDATEAMAQRLDQVAQKIRATTAFKRGLVKIYPYRQVAGQPKTGVHYTFANFGQNQIHQEKPIDADTVAANRDQRLSLLVAGKAPFTMLAQGFTVDESGVLVLQGAFDSGFNSLEDAFIEAGMRKRHYPRVDFNFAVLTGALTPDEETEWQSLVNELADFYVGLRDVTEVHFVNHRDDMLADNLETKAMPLGGRSEARTPQPQGSLDFDAVRAWLNQKRGIMDRASRLPSGAKYAEERSRLIQELGSIVREASMLRTQINSIRHRTAYDLIDAVESSASTNLDRLRAQRSEMRPVLPLISEAGLTQVELARIVALPKADAKKELEAKVKAYNKAAGEGDRMLASKEPTPVIIPSTATKEEKIAFLQGVVRGEFAWGNFAAGAATRLKVSSAFDRIGLLGLTGKILANFPRKEDVAPEPAQFEPLIQAALKGVVNDESDFSFLQNQMLSLRLQLEDLVRENPEAGVSLQEVLDGVRVVNIGNDDNFGAFAAQAGAIRKAGFGKVYQLEQFKVGVEKILPTGLTDFTNDLRVPEGHADPLIAMGQRASGSFEVTSGGLLVPVRTTLAEELRKQGVKRVLFAQGNDLHLLENFASVERWMTAMREMKARHVQMMMEVVENRIMIESKATKQKGGGTFLNPEGFAEMRDTIGLGGDIFPSSLSRMFYILDLEAISGLTEKRVPQYLNVKETPDGGLAMAREMYSGDLSTQLRSATMQQDAYPLLTYKLRPRTDEALSVIATLHAQPGFKEMFQKLTGRSEARLSQLDAAVKKTSEDSRNPLGPVAASLLEMLRGSKAEKIPTPNWRQWSKGGSLTYATAEQTFIIRTDEAGGISGVDMIPFDARSRERNPEQFLALHSNGRMIFETEKESAAGYYSNTGFLDMVKEVSPEMQPSSEMKPWIQVTGFVASPDGKLRIQASRPFAELHSSRGSLSTRLAAGEPLAKELADYFHNGTMLRAATIKTPAVPSSAAAASAPTVAKPVVTARSESRVVEEFDEAAAPKQPKQWQRRDREEVSVPRSKSDRQHRGGKAQNLEEQAEAEMAAALEAAQALQQENLERTVATEIRNPNAVRSEARLIQAILKSFGVEPVDGQQAVTKLVVAYDGKDAAQFRDAVESALRLNPKATITIAAETAAVQAEAENVLTNLPKKVVNGKIAFEVGDVEAIARRQAVALFNAAGRTNKLSDEDLQRSVFQILKTGALTPEDVRMFALLGQMGGIVGIFNSEKRVRCATQRTLGEVLQAAAQAAESIAKSA